MTEEFLHYVWQFGQFNQIGLKSTDGENISIYNSGFLNENAGPDFFSSKIKIGNALWVGNVEIHLKSSDWYKHKHQFNPAYDNVILHVVFDHDMAVTDRRGQPIPTLELKGRMKRNLFLQYENLVSKKTLIPCENLLSKVDDFVVSHWIDKLGVQRLIRKAELVEKLIEENNGDLEESFYQFLAGRFGFKINAVPFRLLAKMVPVKKIARVRNNLLQIEALLLGAAGFLEEEFSEEYPKILKREFTVLRIKFGIRPIPKSLWKFYLLRPGNFPYIRIAQFTQLLHLKKLSLNDILESEKLEDIKSKLKVSTSEYWNNHFVLDKVSAKYSHKSLGSLAVNNLIINAIVPFLFAYGKARQREDLKERAISFLEELPAEQNKIIKMWDLMGVRALNSFRTQALIELKNEFCFEKKCLNCNIGKFILKNKIGDTKYSRFL